MLTILTTAALRWMEEHRQRAELRRLLENDDRMLDDMGLRRSEVERALALPMGTNVADEARRMSLMSLKLDRRA